MIERFQRFVKRLVWKLGEGTEMSTVIANKPSVKQPSHLEQVKGQKEDYPAPPVAGRARFELAAP